MRRTRSLVALAMLALIGAGCASGPADTANDPGSGGSRRDQAVAFAECMRDNGVEAFPDPDASGELTIDAIANGTELDPSTPAFTEAIDACKDLQPAGFTGDPVSPEQQDARLAFARCIRDNGVADFPDPTADTPLVDTNRIPSLAASDDLSVLNAAMETCSDLVADQLGGR